MFHGMFHVRGTNCMGTKKIKKIWEFVITRGLGSPRAAACRGGSKRGDWFIEKPPMLQCGKPFHNVAWTWLVNRGLP